MTDFWVELAPYGRRPSVRRLKRNSVRGGRSRWKAVASVFLARFVLALPDEPLEAFGALFEPLEKLLRLVRRVVAGPGMRGGWDSDAGRLALAGHVAYWERDAMRTDEVDLVLVVTSGTVTVRTHWQAEDQAVSRRHAGVRATPWFRRRRRRVDLVFPDGSWLTLRASQRTSADRLRALLTE